MLWSASVAVAGPLDALYLTAGDDSTIYVVQGSSVTTFGQEGFGDGEGNEYAIAVGSTVRTLANGNTTTLPLDYGDGAEYTLGGVWTSQLYPYPPTSASFYDGTRDATYNYSVDFSTGDVYSMNLDWTNPQVLFNSGISNALGITYDSKNESLWIAEFQSSQVSQFSMTGTLLSSFSVSATIGFIAYDAGDNSLWFGGIGDPTIYQYDTDGNFLSSESYQELDGSNILGGEFAYAPVPEPSTFALLGLGGIGLTFNAYRRRLVA